jgi:hypothetical protein
MPVARGLERHEQIARLQRAGVDGHAGGRPVALRRPPVAAAASEAVQSAHASPPSSAATATLACSHRRRADRRRRRSARSHAPCPRSAAHRPGPAHRRRAGSPRPGRRPRSRPGQPSSTAARIAAGSSLRGLSSVTKTRSAFSPPPAPSAGACPRSRSPPAPTTTTSRPITCGRSALQRGGHRVGRVGVIDEDRRAVVAPRGQLHPPAHGAHGGQRVEHTSLASLARRRWPAPPPPARSRPGTRRSGQPHLVGSPVPFEKRRSCPVASKLRATSADRRPHRPRGSPPARAQRPHRPCRPAGSSILITATPSSGRTRSNSPPWRRNRPRNRRVVIEVILADVGEARRRSRTPSSLRCASPWRRPPSRMGDTRGAASASTRCRVIGSGVVWASGGFQAPSTPVVPRLTASRPIALPDLAGEAGHRGLAVGAGDRDHRFGLRAEPQRGGKGQRLARVLGTTSARRPRRDHRRRSARPRHRSGSPRAHAQRVLDEFAAMHPRARQRGERDAVAHLAAVHRQPGDAALRPPAPSAPSSASVCPAPPVSPRSCAPSCRLLRRERYTSQQGRVQSRVAAPAAARCGG